MGNEDAAHDCLADLGKLGVLQFTDLNPELTPFQRRYVSYVKRCDELERKLRFFNAGIEKFGLESAPAGSIEAFLSTSVGTTKQDPGAALGQLEQETDTYEAQLKELNSYNEKLTHEFNEKVEYQEVLEKSLEFFTFEEGGETGKRLDIMKFQRLAGVVSTDEIATFNRMIFRTTRGNSLVRFAEIDHPITDPETAKSVSKSVFLIFYKSPVIEVKLKKICDAFQAHRYNLPDMEDPSLVQKLMEDNKVHLIDSRTVLLKNRDTRYKVCKTLSANVERWTWIVLKEKAIYHTLNQMKADVSGMLRGEGWVISENKHEAIMAVDKAHANMDMAMPSMVRNLPQPWPTPPTYFVTNKFTYGFQEFVNTYGIPRYREANPALFTAATFPFLFGVMYGDIGHGSFLFCAGLYLLYNEKTNEKARLGEMMGGMHDGRYMITMMGFFAVYAGFIYNDMFSLGLNLFKSRWYFANQDMGREYVEEGAVATQIANYGDPETVYPFGLDPIWHVAQNELLFFNSFKMKLSVIMGIMQMFMGTILKGMNAIYFGETYDLLFEVIPMIAFASSLFVYMVVLIFMTWTIDWDYRMMSATCLDPDDDIWGSDTYDFEWVNNPGDNGYSTPGGVACYDGITTEETCPLDYGGSGDGCQPPNLITTLINIALMPGNVDEPMYAGQESVQLVLLLIAFGSVPILLLAKPYFLSRDMEAQRNNSQSSDEENGGHGDEEHGFGEIVIHQAIETIEFVLGMVSNTASYLRLWALSLAHSELATVFWEKAMLSTLEYNFFAAFTGSSFRISSLRQMASVSPPTLSSRS